MLKLTSIRANAINDYSLCTEATSIYHESGPELGFDYHVNKNAWVPKVLFVYLLRSLD